MKTMIPLRVVGIVSNGLFMAYGLASGALPILILHSTLLPLNLWRLRQMVNLINKVRTAASSDLSIGWLKPFMNARSCKAGEVLFYQGEIATRMFYVVSGTFSLVELGIVVPPGSLVGEIGLVTPGNQRTSSFRCDTTGEVLEMDYQKVMELYFQNPQFGIYLLRLIGDRLVKNANMLKGQESVVRSSFAPLQEPLKESVKD